MFIAASTLLLGMNSYAQHGDLKTDDYFPDVVLGDLKEIRQRQSRFPVKCGSGDDTSSEGDSQFQDGSAPDTELEGGVINLAFLFAELETDELPPGENDSNLFCEECRVLRTEPGERLCNKCADGEEIGQSCFICFESGPALSSHHCGPVVIFHGGCAQHTLCHFCQEPLKAMNVDLSRQDENENSTAEDQTIAALIDQMTTVEYIGRCGELHRDLVRVSNGFDSVTLMQLVLYYAENQGIAVGSMESSALAHFNGVLRPTISGDMQMEERRPRCCCVIL